MNKSKQDYLSGKRVEPEPLTGSETVAELVDNAFLAYNSGRLREACRLFVDKMLADDCTVGMSLTGAMTPAGLGMSAIIPLIEAGFVDWIVSTSANTPKGESSSSRFVIQNSAADFKTLCLVFSLSPVLYGAFVLVGETHRELW